MDFTSYEQVFTGFNWFLLGLTEDFMGFTEFEKNINDFNEFQWVLLGYYKVYTGFY